MNMNSRGGIYGTTSTNHFDPGRVSLSLDVPQPARFSIQFHLHPDNVFPRAAETLRDVAMARRVRRRAGLVMSEEFVTLGT